MILNPGKEQNLEEFMYKKKSSYYKHRSQLYLCHKVTFVIQFQGMKKNIEVLKVGVSHET